MVACESNFVHRATLKHFTNKIYFKSATLHD